MNYILFDDRARNNLLPFTFTRPVSLIRTGILTIAEKWEKVLGGKVSFLTEDYLSGKYPCHQEDDNLLINGSLIPDKSLFESIKILEKGQCLVKGEKPLAARVSAKEIQGLKTPVLQFGLKGIEYSRDLFAIENLWDIFLLNDKALRIDFELITKGRMSRSLPASVQVISPGNIFIEDGVKVEHAIINAAQGPVYLAAGSEVMEGCMIRGPFSLGEHAVLKMGAKIYGATTIGPHSKVGGEVSNSVIFGCSNKAHDGFLGNSVVGEWCNLGADTNNSNLKNNYSNVKIWNYAAKSYIDSGLQFCGLFMGDHSKSGINTMFNTGTVVGVSANVFGAGFPDKFIPSFTWGGAAGMVSFETEKAIALAKEVYKRRSMEFTDTDAGILTHLAAIRRD